MGCNAASMMKTAIGILVAVLCGGGCSATYSMTDDVDVTWDFGVTLSRFDDDLHVPYVRGAKVTVFAHASDDDVDFAGWSIASTDPGVFRIDDSAVDGDGDTLVAHGRAMAEGEAALRLLDHRGREVGRGVAVVRVPDRVELDAHGSLILGRDDEAPVDEARVVAGGTATYLVRYFAGGQQLHGNGVLAVAASDGMPGVIAQARTSFLFENREWLTVTAPEVGTGTLAISADGAAIGDLPLVVVPDSAIADVVVLTQPERGHDDGDWLVALAQAYDSDGERVFGVDYSWRVDGVAQTGDGDLYRYRFKRGALEMVEARRGAHSDAVMIQSDDGFVDSSNEVGCAAGGGGGGALAIGLIGAWLVVTGRRRAGRRRAGR